MMLLACIAWGVFVSVFFDLPLWQELILAFIGGVVISSLASRR